MTRRDATRNFLLFLSGSPTLSAQSQEFPYVAERIPVLNDLQDVLEFEPVCRAKIAKTSYDYVAHGTDDEFTLRRNREAFQWMTLRPRVATDVSRMDLSVELFGQKVEMPILICPTGNHRLVHPEGELATARAASAAKTIMPNCGSLTPAIHWRRSSHRRPVRCGDNCPRGLTSTVRSKRSQQSGGAWLQGHPCLRWITSTTRTVSVCFGTGLPNRICWLDFPAIRGRYGAGTVKTRIHTGLDGETRHGSRGPTWNKSPRAQRSQSS